MTGKLQVVEFIFCRLMNLVYQSHANEISCILCDNSRESDSSSSYLQRLKHIRCTICRRIDVMRENEFNTDSKLTNMSRSEDER